MKSTSAWLATGTLLAAFCLNTHVAEAQCVVGTSGASVGPTVGGNGSYDSNYNTCNTNGFTARVWLNQYTQYAGWKRVQGKRSNACLTLQNGWLSVRGEFLNFATGGIGGAYRFGAAPYGCSGGTTVSYTLT